ncbi:MAG: GNAT family N-acetyltransferase [Pseudomonadota bacterium]
MEIVVRAGMPGDAETLTDLCFRSKRSNGYDAAFMEACRDELTVSPRDLREQTFWVAVTTEGDVCGCCSLEIDPGARSGEVCVFFIDPDWQRKGVGRKLWIALLGTAAEHGLKRLELDADPFAVPFYESVGFKVVDEAPSASIPGRMIPYMTQELAPAKTRI